MKKGAVLLLAADESVRRALKRLLLRRGLVVIEASTTSAAMPSPPVDVVVVGSGTPDGHDGPDIARCLLRHYGTLPVILVTVSSSEDVAVAALRAGVRDYFKMPIVDDAFVVSVERAMAGAAPSRAPQQTAERSA